MTHLCLIRHGQTNWNVQGRYTGQSDIPLNGTGKIQAKSLIPQLQNRQIDAIFSSDLLRASETARIISDYFQIPVQLDSRLREINQGVWEGQHLDDIKLKYNEIWQQRETNPHNVRPPGGETLSEVSTRVITAIEEIASKYPDGAVLIISHGLAIALILCKIKDIPMEQAYDLIPSNTEPIWIDWK
jgi:alpha-ribazole phosphatase